MRDFFRELLDFAGALVLIVTVLALMVACVGVFQLVERG